MNNKKPSLFATEMAFTGPRSSYMKPEQRSAVIQILNKLRPCLVHNGCAKGRDEELIEILIKMKLPTMLRLWPADKERMDYVRALTLGAIRTEWRATGLNDPLKRNRLMVEAAEWLLAVPDGTKPIGHGSGTWYTIKHALKVGTQVVAIWPDGEVDPNYGR